jgi:hypothetical protein
VTGLVVEPSEESPLEAMTKVAPAALSRVVAKRYLSVELPGSAAKGKRPSTGPASEGVRVLARWNDAEGRPAAVEKRFGRGRVVLWTVTADKQWSDWPVEPTYVLAMRSAAAAAARPDAGEGADALAGQPVRCELPDGQDAVEPRVTPPGGQPEVAAVEKREGAPAALKYTRTAKAGVYVFTWKDATGKEHSRPVAVNPDRAESELEPISEQELAGLMGDLRPPVIRYAAGRLAASGQGREVWRTLMWTVLAMAAVETVFAVWVGRER